MKTYHVHHILVRHSYEAEDILKKISSGKSFAELAKKLSLCSSAKAEGDLGILTLGKADEDFEKASLAIKPDEITQKPIRTRFGFHIIKRIS